LRLTGHHIVEYLQPSVGSHR